MAPSTADEDAVRQMVRTVLADYPVTVGFLFGSLARGDATDASDIDVAVAFTDQPSVVTDHTEQRLALSTDLALELGTDAVDVVELLRDTVATYDSSVAVEAPDSLIITTDRAALEAAIESAVDNAVTHATNVTTSLQQTPDGCEIRVTDDGPGIPESELSALETRTETALQHGTGLGLWQLTWAARTLAGNVSFDTSNGTTVTITVSDASSTGRPETTS